MNVDPRLEVAPPLQRATYRTVLEALTNVRKHAPGASATVSIRRQADELITGILNTAGSRQATPLPSNHQGLVGLCERAELLGGTVTAGRPRPAGSSWNYDYPSDDAPDLRTPPNRCHRD